MTFGNWRRLHGYWVIKGSDRRQGERIPRFGSAPTLEKGQLTRPLNDPNDTSTYRPFHVRGKNGDEQFEKIHRTIELFGEAYIPIARPAFATSSYVWLWAHQEPAYRLKYRGSYTVCSTSD
ncbi:MAG: hypothetical protein QXI32_05540 [Candidatus Bathyarchaeia archaeon]